MKLLLWDFDGVIVDTFKISHDILSTLGPGAITESQLRRIFDRNPYDSPEIKSRLPNHLSIHTPFFKEYVPRLLTRSSIPGIKTVLKKLASTCPLVIVSSTIDSAIATFLDQECLTPFFQKIYGVNTEKSKIKKIQKAMKDFNTAPEDTIFITDTLGDINEANQVGVRSIGVTWGYQKKSSLQKGNPIAIVDHPRELIVEIQKYIHSTESSAILPI